jgi:hypothetical protein
MPPLTQTPGGTTFGELLARATRGDRDGYRRCVLKSAEGDRVRDAAGVGPGGAVEMRNADASAQAGPPEGFRVALTR